MASTPDEKEWQAEHDLGVLVEAEEIKRDKKRLAAALKRRDEKLADLAKIEK